MVFVGNNCYALYGAQSNFTTAAATTKSIGKVLSFTPSITNNFIRDRGVGQGRDVDDALLGPFDVTGTISWEVQDFAFFEFAWGTLTNSGAGPYVHTLNASDNLQSFTMRVGHVGADGSTNVVDRYVGCVMNNVRLTQALNAPLIAEADFVAYTFVESNDTSAYTASTEKPWMYSQGDLQIDSTSFGKIETFTYSLSNNLNIFHKYNDRRIETPVSTARNHEWSMTHKSGDNDTMVEFMLGQAPTSGPADGVASPEPTAFNIILDYTNDASNHATVTLSNCFIDTLGRPIDGPDAIVVENTSGFAKTASLVYTDSVASP